MMNKKIMLTMMATISFFMTITPKNVEQSLEYGYQKYENIFKPLKAKKKSKNKPSKNKPIKTIDFIPEQVFDGNDATGTYDSKNQTATITTKNNETIYNFTQMIANRTNASIPDKKNLDPDITLIGSFSTKTNHAGMPVTTYLFGVPEHKTLPIANTPKKLPTIDLVNLDLDSLDSDSLDSKPIGSNPATYAPVIFNPSDQFADDGLVGNYFAATRIATIHDSSGANNNSYTFENVQEGGSQKPDGLILIGSYSPPARCQGNICSHARFLINLYGILKPEEQDVADIPAQ